MSVKSVPGRKALPDRRTTVFKDFTVTGAVKNGEKRIDGAESYVIWLKPNDARNPDSRLTVTGSVGRGLFDRVNNPDPAYVVGSCAPEATYCQLLTSARVGSPPPNEELFRGLTVQGKPAVVQHIVCCNAMVWEALWFDEAENMTYSFAWSFEAAERFGGEPRADAANRRIADLVIQAATSTIAL
jgi:hypothetical protein